MVKFDSTESGLRKTLKEYEEIALRHLWIIGEEGAAARPVWEHVSDELKKKDTSISRASVYVFLNELWDQGVLGYREETAKGGRHRVYYPLMDERGYRKFMLQAVMESMMRDFPEETREVLGE